METHQIPQEEKFKNFVMCKNVLMVFWDAYGFVLRNCQTKGRYKSILLLHNTASPEGNGPDEVNL
jgi:hypothetical protein